MKDIVARHAVVGVTLVTLCACAMPASQPPPVRTYVLYPGHWQLVGSRYVWVKGDETLREVIAQTWVKGHYVWRDRDWVWVPGHYVW